MERETANIQELIAAEEQFLKLSMPSHAYPSEQVVASSCCEKKCVLFLRRIDILQARYLYMKFINNLNDTGKREARYLFIDTLKRLVDDETFIVPLVNNLKSCHVLMARVFGLSLHVLLNGIAGTTINSYTSRPWYRPTVDAISETLRSFSGVIQMNSLDRLMLPPNFQNRIPDNSTPSVPLKVLRTKMDLQIQSRRSDSLTRCTACSVLPGLISSEIDAEKKSEAQFTYKLHLNQQRVIIQTLCDMSREKDTDLAVVHLDGMSNKHSKLPHLVSRPKCISDSDRIALSLMTVQLALRKGDNKYRNYEFPVVNGVYTQNSSYVLSVLMDTLSKLEAMPSVLVLVMDSCRMNKSYVFMAGIGYLLEKVQHLKKVIILFPCVGHTHLSVDQHFGTVTKMSATQDLYSPSDYCKFLSGLPSVENVEPFPTIYNFSELDEYVQKVPNVCSHGQVSISRDSDGTVNYSTGLTMDSSELIFGKDSDKIAFKMFKPEYITSNYAPTVTSPNLTEIQNKLDILSKSAGAVLSKDHIDSFMEIEKRFGRKSIAHVLSLITAKPPKTRKMDVEMCTDAHMTVIEFLQKEGYNAGRKPKAPPLRNVDVIRTTSEGSSSARNSQ